MPPLETIIALLEASKYSLIFIGSFIEGSIVMLGTGILWHNGLVAFWPAYGALLLGDILADLMWYAIGYFGARRFMNRWGHHINMTPEVVAKIEKHFHNHHTSILVVSKLTMGFGFAVATLTTAGMLRVPLLRYFLINLLGGIVWVLTLLVVGYYFGNVLELVPTEFKIALGVAGLTGAFFGLKYFAKRLASSEW
jgi:membrane-associated protein